MNPLQAPEFAYILLLGPESVTQPFAAKHFPPHEVISLRTLADMTAPPGTALSDETANIAANIVELRLRQHLRTIVTGAGANQKVRTLLRQAARRTHTESIAWALLPADSHDPAEAAAIAEIRDLYDQIRVEGHDKLQVIAHPVDQQVQHVSLPGDLRHLTGPFDIVGGIHGCHDEFLELLGVLGYHTAPGSHPRAPAGRKLIVLGDVAGLGPKSPEALRTVRAMVEAGDAIALSGNLDHDLSKWMRDGIEPGHQFLQHMQPWLQSLSAAQAKDWADWLGSLPSHLVLADGRLIATHAGIQPDLILRSGKQVLNFCRAGETPGDQDHWGHPVSLNWARAFDEGDRRVVHAHKAVFEAEWDGMTLNLDTGCRFGGPLSALRFPEMLIAQSLSGVAHSPSRKAARATEAASNIFPSIRWTLLNGHFLVSTKSGYSFSPSTKEVNTSMAHFACCAVDPRWIIHLPASISPPQAAQAHGYLEHIQEGLSYFEKKGFTQVTVEEKVDGLRVVAVVCRDAKVAGRRFGVRDGSRACIHTRDGAPLPASHGNPDEWIAILSCAIDAAGLWEGLKTDWLCLDAIIAHPQEWLDRSCDALSSIRSQAAQMQADLIAALHDFPSDDPNLSVTAAAIRAEADEWARIALAEIVPSHATGLLHPLHLVASEGRYLLNESLSWHHAILERLCVASEGRIAQPRRMEVAVHDYAQREAASEWFLSLSQTGKPGLVVKAGPPDGAQGADFIQPAIKVRGREYLRLIYGGSYTLPTALAQHRGRSLKTRRELVVRQLALAKEALTRLLADQPLEAIHQIIFTAHGAALRDDDIRL